MLSISRLRSGALGAALLVACAAHAPLLAQEVVERDDFSPAFTDHGVEGTFVLYDLDAERRVLIGVERAEERFPPASTFKIPNSLIALESGVVSDLEEVLPYGGGETRVAAWAQDMTLGQAFAASNVPIYQGIARQIGLETMTEMLTRLDYGNAEAGEVVDRFWLDGPLAISATEQTDFLAALLRDELPFSQRSVELLREIAFLDEEEGGARIYGKTGWAYEEDGVQVGWIVGWIEGGTARRTFALNMEMGRMDLAPLRLEIAKTLLRELDAL